jgi:hypothetical protein
MALHFSAQRWQDQLMVLLGLWLIISPMALDYAPGSAEAINAYVAGAVIAVLAAFDLYQTYVWAVLLNLAVGVWVAVSPWALQVAGVPSITSNFVIAGLAVVVLALWELRSDPELHRQWAGQEKTG